MYISENEFMMNHGIAWWKTAKIYELYVDKFAGDFRGLTEKLDYLSNLGINTVHILPHYPSPMIDDGYDITDYRNVRPELGTLADMQEFVATARKRGIHVILDMVLNHVSSSHPWFIEARSSRTNPKRDYFLWSDTGSEYALSSNMFPDIKERNWIPNPQTGDFYFATFYPEQPDLNWDNPDVIEGMLANIDFWADMGVDGFRLDAACFLIKRDGTTCKGLPETHAMIKMIRHHLDEKYSAGIILLGEAAQSIEDSIAYFGNGDECHMMYHFPLMTEMWLALRHNDLSHVEQMVRQSFDIPPNCAWATFLRNHDEIELRILPSQDVRTDLISFLDPKKEYLCNQGQGTSMRIASVFDGDKEKILGALRLLFETPGTPIMYYGDEIGMKNLPPDKNIKDTRKFVRGAFDWNAADQQMNDPDSLLSHVRMLLMYTEGRQTQQFYITDYDHTGTQNLRPSIN